LVLIEEDWIYIRQIQNPAFPIININNNLEYVYNIQQNITPVLIQAKNIS